MRNNLIASFVLRLRDQISGPLAAIRARMEGLRRLAGTVALIGGALSAAALAGPIREAAALEGQVRAIGITASLSGQQLAEFTARNIRLFEDLARATNQRQADLARAAGVLVAGGGAAGEAWGDLIPIIGRVATASGAAAGDVASTVLAMVNNLRLAPEQVEPALAGLVEAGKAGQFELRDMAREFASLTAAAAGIGLTGPRAVASLAAALQVARQGAGSAGEAATNLQNILQKMTSADAVRNFREMGIDLERLMANAAERGINPFEALIQKVREVTGGNMFRVQELFADQQVLGFLRPMLQQVERYIEIRDAAAAAPVSLIATDQRAAMEGLAAAVQRLTVAWDELSNVVGRAAVGPLQMLGDLFFGLLDGIRTVEAVMPGLTSAIGVAAAALIGGAGLIAALGVLQGLLLAGGPLLLGLAALAAGAVLIAANFDRIRAAVRSAGEAIEAFFARRRELTDAAAAAAPGAAQQSQRLFRENPTRGFYSAEQDAEIARLLRELGTGLGEGAGARRQDGQVEIIVRPAPGAEVVGVEATGGNLRVTTPDRGATRGRP